MKKLFTTLIFLFVLAIGLNAQAITVTAPNGGENWAGCSQQTITWTSSGTSDFYTIDYSLDNGASWIAVATFVQSITTPRTFTWDVPNVTTTVGLVRVRDSNDTLTTDVSNAVFSINGPLILTAPNGGENWVTGTNQLITWNANGTSNQYRIEYTVDDGASWNTIISNLSTAGGTYTWNVPNLPSTTAKIRITDVNNATCMVDESNAVFTITSELTVTAPNGGESWEAFVGPQGSSFNMDNVPVTCNTGNFYDNGGPTGNYAGSQNFTKTFTPDVPTNKLRFQFRDFRTFSSGDRLIIYNGPSTSFPLIGTYSSTSSPGTVTSTHASGALTFRWISDCCSHQRGWDAIISSVGSTTQDITWNINGTSKVFDIDYSTNNGTSWIRIVSNYASTSGVYSWTVPNTPSTTCLTRVIDNDNGSILDVSDANFTIGPPTPFIVVTAPNGGETRYGGQSMSITWLDAFTSNANVMLEYSSNNGSTWTTIVASTANTGSYSWVTPAFFSADYLVRVSEVGAPSVNDVSDANFEILKNVVLTSPVGGEALSGCSDYTIRWNAGGDSNNWDIDYTTDNGTTWISITSGLFNSSSTPTYTWTTLPNFNAPTTKIRVLDAGDPAKGDTSAAFFSMNATQNLQVQTPNGGEIWTANTTQAIVYPFFGDVVNVSIEYSLDSGANWILLTSNTSGGVYNWTLPNVNSTTAMVRVRDINRPDCNLDSSDAVFTIISELTVTDPNGGENLTATVGTQGFTYTMNNIPIVCNTGNFYDNGGPTGNYSGSLNFTKTFTPDVPTNKLRFQFRDFRTFSSGDRLIIYNGPNTSSPLIGTYSSTSSPGTVTSTHSTGALTFRWISDCCSHQRGWDAIISSIGGNTEPITWNNTGTSATYDIEYSTNSGTSWIRIVTNYLTGSGTYNWTVPNTQSSTCLTRVIDHDNNTILDTSDATFTIGPPVPFIVVTAPVGGETRYGTQGMSITWVSAFLTNPNVMIEYSPDNGTTWIQEIASTPNDGQYTWTVPQVPGDQYLVRVSEVGAPAVNDESDAVFEIFPNIVVTSTNGGETLTGCGTHTIRWTAGGDSNVFDLYYSLDGGTTWLPLVLTHSNTSTNATYTWPIVPNINNNQLMFAVTDANDPTKTDTSDAVANISKTVNVTVSSPNGGEIWTANTTQAITYPTNPSVTNVRIEYSTDNGVTWTTIISSTNGGVYNWTVPNINANQAIVKVTDVNNPSCNVDSSDAVFTIISNLTVTNPNGGENLTATVGVQGFSYTMDNIPVTCNTGNFYDNGGPNGNYSGSLNFTKTFTPDVPTNKLRFQFRDFRTFSSGDRLIIYNGPNTSSPLIGTYSSTSSPGTVTSTHSTGALTFRWISDCCSHQRGWDAIISSIGGNTEPITWSKNGTSNTYDIDYSTNNGVSWIRIVSNYLTGSGTYNWSVPNTQSANCLTRVIDHENNTILDTSDATFTIGPPVPFIVVTSPTGGETRYGTQSLTITWISAFLANPNVMIEYSPDNGTSWVQIVATTPNDGTYSWVVPQLPGDQYLIRVSEVGTPAVNDVSDGPMEIFPNITITSTNGGETLTGCGTHTVRWTAGGDSNVFDLYYSLDGGTTWLPLILNHSNTSTNAAYTWPIVPNINNNQLLVAVTDVNDPTKTDTSDAVANIAQTVNITVASPNGGEIWTANTNQTITYPTSPAVTNVRIEYSTDNGISWTTITSNTSGGVFNWTVPNINTNQAIVKVTDVSNPSCNVDSSDAVFTIISNLTITDPNGGENLTATVGAQGFTYTMSNIPVSCNTGNFYDNGGPTGNYTGSQNFTKTFTPDVPTNKLRFQFRDFRTFSSGDRLIIYNGPNTSSPLIGTYSSTSSPGTVTSTHSTGALTFRWISDCCSHQRGWDAIISSIGGNTEPITWTQNGTSNVYDIEYSTNNGSSWIRIVSNYLTGAGIYNWSVPNTQSSNCLVRVIDNDNNTILDTSDATFTIGPPVPFILVTSPVGGETRYGTQGMSITWVSAFLSNPNVMIEYSPDNGTTWIQEIASTPNDGQYTWTVPQVPGDQYLVRVSEVGTPAVNDESDAVMEIFPNIVVTSSNGGETLTGCGTYPVRWTAGGDSNVFDLYYSLDGGITWLPLILNHTNTSTNATYTWPIVPNINNNQLMFAVTDANDPTKTDTSDAVANIAKTVNVTVASPNGGEIWTANTTQTITYPTNPAVTSVRIEYSTDNGLTYTTIISNTIGGVYNWSVPNINANQVIVKVTDNNNPSCNVDSSDAVFTIISNLTVTEPNGGENLTATVGTQGFTYTMDNIPVICNTGNFYDNGGPNANYTGSQNFTKTFTPDVPTHKLRFQFRDFRTFSSGDRLIIYNGPTTSSPLIGTYSSTSSPGTVTSTHTTGALTFRWISDCCSHQRGWDAIISSVGGNTEEIRWTKNGTSNTYDIDYSTNNGVSWIRIVTNYSTGSGLYNWTVPNTPSANCLTRVIDHDNNTIMDTSDAVFTIGPPVPFIVVTSPAGGETRYGTQGQSITWLSAFVGNPNVMIEYSPDLGGTWVTIEAVTPNDGQYTWTVPQLPGDEYLVRVSEVGNPAVNDVSDGPMEILKNVVLTNPNGGEMLSGCGNHTIQWTAGGDGNYFDIDYTTDGGATWVVIADSLYKTQSTPTHVWSNLPNVSYPSMLLRVRDVADTTKGDTSDAPFSLNMTQNVTVGVPNGGEVWVTGTVEPIAYPLLGGVTNVRIEYSVDNGTNWSFITTNTSGGVYNWTVPNLPTTTALIRISDVTNPGCNVDVSDANFTIVSDLTITQPNGGEIWQATVGTQGGAYTMDNIPVICNTGNFYDAGGPNANYTGSQNFTKTFTPDVPTNKLRFQFTDFRTFSSGDRLIIYNGPNTSSPLIGTYSSTSSPGTVTSTHSTGALTFRWISDCCSHQRGWEAIISSIGSPTQNITWSEIGTSNTFDIDYSTDGGNNWIRVVSEYPTTQSFYPWTVPNTPSTTCRVRVTDADNGVIVDESDANFTILSAAPLVVAPNGNETWYDGQSRTITWAAATFLSSQVLIEFSDDNGLTWSVVNAATLNDGTYNWTVPSTTVPLVNCLIRVSEVGNTSVNDICDNVFSINPNIRITTPNGDNGFQTWRACTQSTITWIGGTTTRYNLDLSTDNGVTWSNIATNYFEPNLNASYSWSIPNTPSTQCLIRVSNFSNAAVLDVSDSTFTISPTLTITAPNNGGVFSVGQLVNVTWATNGTSNFFNLDYSTDGGVTWTNMATNFSTTMNTYAWTVPNDVSTNVMIRVEDNLSACKSDITDIAFTITTLPQFVNVTYPNGGEVFDGCTTENIAWTDSSTSGAFNIDYSDDGGISWNNIVTNYSGGSPFTWTVPNEVSSNATVRVMDAVDPTKVDQSDAVFTLDQSIAATVTPTGTISFCNGQSITLTSGRATGNLWNPGGQTSQSIVVSTSGTYTLTVDSSGCAATSDPVIVTVNPNPLTPTISASGPTTICAGDNLILSSSSGTNNTWSPLGETTQDISVTTSGNYSVTVTDGNGCSATSAPVSVTVTPTPTAPVAGSNSPVPLGGTINLSASTIPSATYAWTGPNAYTANQQNPSIPNATLAEGGTYAVTASVNGCMSPAATVSVVVSGSGSVVNMAGSVLSEGGDPVQGVTLVLTGSGANDTVVTNLTGTWDFDMISNSAYTITPTKANDVTTNNGVTTLDIVSMRRHILNTDTLPSAYKVIAGDVDGNQNVTTLDIVFTRQVVLQTQTTFPGGRLWDFVPADHVFTNAVMPWPFPNTKSIASASAATGEDIVGIKLGDVNDSWNYLVLKDLIDGTVVFQTEDLEAQPGDLVTIPVNVADFADVAGYQYTLNWDPTVLEYVSVENKALNGFYGEHRVNEGILTTLWTDDNGDAITLDPGTEAFALTFRVVGDMGTASALSISSDATPVEACNDALMPMDIKMIAGKVSVTDGEQKLSAFDGYYLFQNVPNPFDDLTELRFEIPQAQRVVLTVYNLNGEKVRAFEGWFDAGMHQVEWTGRNANGVQLSNGTYFVQMQAGDFVDVKKMMLLK